MQVAVDLLSRFKGYHYAAEFLILGFLGFCPIRRA